MVHVCDPVRIWFVVKIVAVLDCYPEKVDLDLPSIVFFCVGKVVSAGLWVALMLVFG
jgi:hypothetical protein